MFLHPSRIVELLDVRPGMKVADFGCGAGHFTIEIAKRVSKDGIVYAFDVQKEVLDALKSKAVLENVANIEYRRVDLEAENGTQLADDLVDVVLISNVLFQVGDKESLAKESSRILKSGGRIVFIDWKLSASLLGPPKSSRIDKESAIKLFSNVGLTVEKDFDAGDSHYGVVFMKR
ncbi:MAG: methyltransferase domain-containing protein [Candidatus Marinimicrobia bacterium]|nr:methyltransferase domain-containing protein [Candidatus Neomarinimicrobiota bacterium]